MNNSTPLDPLAIEAAAVLMACAPPHARSVRILGCGPDQSPLIAARTPFPAHLSVTATAAWPTRRIPQDCLLLTPPALAPPDLDLLCGRTAPILSSYSCALLAVFAGPRWPSELMMETAIPEMVRRHGLEVYRSWPISGGAPGMAILAVRDDYDPVAHARRLLETRAAARAYQVLSEIPETLRAEPEAHALVLAMMELCMAMADNVTGAPLPPLDQFHIGHMIFQQATRMSQAPPVQAFISHAAYWRKMGEPSMALGLLDTIEAAVPGDPAVLESRCSLPEVVIRRASPLLEPPEWSGRTSPRVLMVNYFRPDYGLDLLLEGLHRVLGSANTVEFPTKDSVHGRSTELCSRYPCHFNLPERTLTFDETAALLRDGAFDVVLYGDTYNCLPAETARLISACAASSSTPVFIVDQSDDFVDNRAKVLAWLGRAKVNGYFKREMLACADYGSGAYPLPFCYSQSYMDEAQQTERAIPLFWAGDTAYGTRRICLERLAKTRGLDIHQKLTQQEYTRHLRESRIALDFSGAGFDTVRYWEVPAHGAMLLAESRPTVIPHNFTNGVSAIFFNGLPELESRLGHYLIHNEETAVIAKTGREHLLRHHTSEARARHLLGWMSAALGW